MVDAPQKAPTPVEAPDYNAVTQAGRDTETPENGKKRRLRAVHGFVLCCLRGIDQPAVDCSRVERPAGKEEMGNGVVAAEAGADTDKSHDGDQLWLW